MELYLSVAVLACFAGGYYVYSKKKMAEMEKRLQRATIESLAKAIAQKEHENKKSIILAVNNFIKNSYLVEPLFHWKNEVVYKYIYNSDKLYEFSEILGEDNNKFGMNEETLCFKNICYKRTHDLNGFFEKFGKQIQEVAWTES